MLRYMLDTNICIYAIKDRPASLRETFNALSGQLAISSVALGELLFGAEKSAQRQVNLSVVEAFTARLEVLSFDAKAAGHFGDIRATLGRAGTPIGAYDLMIGAHARAEGLILVTNNQREFARIDGLRLENWV
jgi:tRNA(fMet)-specific endonuclease VapC